MNLLLLSITYIIPNPETVSGLHITDKIYDNFVRLVLEIQL